MIEHPWAIAARWATSFRSAGLRDTLYAKQLVSPLAALCRLHTIPMPWKVRLYVLVHGVIPESYLEKFDGE